MDSREKNASGLVDSVLQSVNGGLTANRSTTELLRSLATAHSREKEIISFSLEKRLAEHNDPICYSSRFTKRIPGQDSCSLLRLRTLSKASTARKASSAAAFTSVIVGCNCRKYCHARSSYILKPVSLLMATTIADRVSLIESLFGHFASESQKGCGFRLRGLR